MSNVEQFLSDEISDLEVENKELKDQNKKANELLVKIFEQDRFNEDYFDLELINEVRVHVENN